MTLPALPVKTYPVVGGILNIDSGMVDADHPNGPFIGLTKLYPHLLSEVMAPAFISSISSVFGARRLRKTLVPSVVLTNPCFLSQSIAWSGELKMAVLTDCNHLMCLSEDDCDDSDIARPQSHMDH